MALCNCDDAANMPAANNQMECNDDVPAAKTDLSNLKVTVGIDEDLQMILEMDPSIVDLVRTQTHIFPYELYIFFLIFSLSFQNCRLFFLT